MNYRVIEIFTSENGHWNGKPAHEAVVSFLQKHKLAARCIVTRGLGGYYEDGSVATAKIEILSLSMPLKIEVALPSSQADTLLAALREGVLDGIVGVRDLEVVAHRTQKGLLPKHLMVRDIMTAGPRSATPDTPVIEIARLLVSAQFNGVPVVDDGGRPVGVITQGDLIDRAKMPVRLGLLAQMQAENKDALLRGLESLKASDIMTSPVTLIGGDARLVDAVRLMLSKGLKRLPVVDASGKLEGMLARWDVFRTITEETPDWKSIETQQITLTGMKTVGDIMRRDTHTVPASATIEEVMHVIDSNDLQRVSVVDDAGALLGLITDRSLLRLFSGEKVGVWERMDSRLTFTEMGRRRKAVMELARRMTAGEVMESNLVTVSEDTPLEEVVRLMTAHQIKRLPVLDGKGVFKGMVSRDSLLRAELGDA